ncbi:MAG TPA: hydrogenase expression/formation protein HypE [Myxococcaceae bacterium]|jgi:hydrogenase expression/formation protein HypE
MAAPFGACPVQIGQYDRVVLGHGSGGRLTHELITQLFVPAFHNPTLAALEDQASIAVEGRGRLAFTTDAFVVSPVFFPGGDIGKLAVCGTVNDLAAGGAIPRHLAASFILEEGLPLANLRRIVESMRRACDEAGVTVVAGDTKVVERGKADGLFITTTGIGWLPEDRRLSIGAARPGDKVVVSGPLGDHGMAILSVRQGLSFDTQLLSDCAPLAGLAQVMLRASPSLRCMRDPTRGGLASVLNELAAASRVGVVVQEPAVPVRPEVRGACEMLGLDPLYVACEGRMVAVAPAPEVPALLAAMGSHPLGQGAAEIGEVVPDFPGKVRVRSSVGGDRMLLMLSGEQLPRIC